MSAIFVGILERTVKRILTSSAWALHSMSTVIVKFVQKLEGEARDLNFVDGLPLGL